MIDKEIKLRAADEADLSAISEMEKEIYPAPYSDKTIADILTSQTESIYVASVEDKIAGYVIFSMVLDEGELLRISTSKDFRRRGIGKCLIRQMLDIMQKRKVGTVFLEVRKTNEPAIKMYENENFKVIAERKNYYSNPTTDALIMKRG